MKFETLAGRRRAKRSGESSKERTKEIEDAGMAKRRSDGFCLMLLGCLIFVLLGTGLERISSVAMVDFKLNYYPARCLVQHLDPYQMSNVWISQQSAGDNFIPGGFRYNYLPTVFTFTVPFGLLPYGPAHFLWIALTIGSLILASFLTWELGAQEAPVLSGALIGFLVANSELIIVVGNVAGIAVSLCVVAVWCFLRERYLAVGVVCLAMSLALKPHDGGLVWLYFLMAGGNQRRRAWQTLAVTIVISLPAVLWVTHVAPHWIQELQSNMLSYSAHGSTNDPGPASSGAHALAMMINLQTALAGFRDDPKFYNPATYFICGVLLLIWSAKALRSSFSPKAALFAIAAIAPLTMLPVYHREPDAKLLLLTIPACAILIAEGGLVGRLAMVTTSAAFVMTAEIPWAVVLQIRNHIHPSSATLGQVMVFAQILPIPISLLVASAFYIWVYVGRTAQGKPSLP
jgi:hypothetical protein